MCNTCLLISPRNCRLPWASPAAICHVPRSRAIALEAYRERKLSTAQLRRLCGFENSWRLLSARRAIDLPFERWDNPTMIVTLDSKRRLTVPASLAPASPGEYFDARFDAEEDAIVFHRLPEKGKEDWLAVLKECPVSMDDIPSRRRETARRRKL